MGHAHESRPQHPLCDPCQRVFKDKLSRQQVRNLSYCSRHTADPFFVPYYVLQSVVVAPAHGCETRCPLR